MEQEKIAILREPLIIEEGFGGYSNYRIYAKSISIIEKRHSFKFMDSLNRLMQAKAIGDEAKALEENELLDSLEVGKTTERGKGMTEATAQSNFWFYWKIHNGALFLRTNHFFPQYVQTGLSKTLANNQST